jgi:hypothetical protein
MGAEQSFSMGTNAPTVRRIILPISDVYASREKTQKPLATRICQEITNHIFRRLTAFHPNTQSIRSTDDTYTSTAPLS